MILEENYQKIQEELNEQQHKISDEQVPQQPQPQQQTLEIQPIISEMMFIPPPINDSSKHQDQLQNDFLETISKSEANLDYITVFGQKRPINLMDKKLPEPLFVDGSVKTRLKKMVRNLYEKMIQNLKYSAGQMPINYSSPLPKITQKTHQFMILCEQIQVAQTKAVIWKMMQEQTKSMNQKSHQIEEFIEGMVQYCKNQQQKKSNS